MAMLSRIGDDRKIRSREQITDIGKYSIVNRTIQLCNLQMIYGDSLLKSSNFRKWLGK
jgi:hypothetical protein